MADWKLRLYHQLPHPLRNVAASLRGYQLRRWRYGPETENLVEEALERDTWSAAQWKTYQENRLAYVLHRAATRVPYYREQWAERRRKGDRASWEYLENWPILTKQVLRDGPESFVADDCRISNMFREQTSGTTGTPLKLWWSRETTTAWYALFEARIRRWNEVSISQNWAIMGGQQVVPPQTTTAPFWVRNRALNQLYMSSSHLSRRNAPEFVGAMRKAKITHLYSYTSSATYLAQLIVDLGLDIGGYLKVVITNAEPLFDWQREVLEHAFRCPVRETYGMGEIVAGASADQLDRLRMWPEVGLVETWDDESDQLIPQGNAGRFICTGLFNPDMPLIRYEVGDRGALSTDLPDSSDRVQLPYLGTIEGRSSDLIIAPDGRRIFWLNPVFYGLPVVEAQIVQHSLYDILVRFVPGDGFSQSSEAEISMRLKSLIDNRAHITFEQMRRIPRDANNKLKPVICEMATSIHSQI